MSNKKTQWVSPRDDNKWAVHRAGASKDTAIYRTQAEAIERAREIAKNQGTEVIIQGRDGRIRSKDSYGNDPFPPRDREH